ncbi:MAG: DNA adenine methylase [Candidatus Levybacteria bacterium]|nr:DNA adenine methylase [Candidatus Levybacteria bacterium]
MYKNKLPKLNFIGNKENLAKLICDNIPQGANIFFDAFSGGSSVSFEAKKRGYKVIANDIMKINYIISKALIENSKERLDEDDLKILFSGKKIKGYMYKNYKNILFFPEECEELDQYRDNINKLKSRYKKSLALVLIRRAMVRKMPYSRFNIPWNKIIQLRDEKYSYEKYGRKRAYHNRSIKEHILDNLDEYNSSIFDNKQKNKAMNMNIFNAVKKVKADVIYLDPPYTGTMNNYFSFYGPLDELIDSRKRKSFKDNFIDKKKSLHLFNKLFSSLSNYKYWMLSYNNSSYPAKEDLISLLREYSKNIKLIEINHVYKLTGKENKKNNREFLFVIENRLFKQESKRKNKIRKFQEENYMQENFVSN